MITAPQNAGWGEPFRFEIREHLKSRAQALAAWRIACPSSRPRCPGEGRQELKVRVQACIAHLTTPINHCRAIRTTNLLECLFVEKRRWMKIMPNACGEKLVLKLMFDAMIRASECWRWIRVTDFEHRQLQAIHA